MKKIIVAAALSFRAASCSAGAPVVPPPAPAAGTELLLCRVDGLLSALDGKTAGAAPDLCPPDFSLNRLPEYVARGGSALDLDRVEADADGYYQARAYAESNPDLCRPLAALQRAVAAVQKSPRVGIGWDPHCRGTYAEMRFVRALVVREGVRESCAETLQSGYDSYGKGDPKTFGRACRAIAENPDDPRAACAVVPQNGEECGNMFRIAAGESSACDKVEEEERDGCYGYAAFARARRGKDAALCGENETCRAIWGDGTAVAARYERRILSDVAPALLMEASAALAAASARSPEQARAVRERAERVARLLPSGKGGPVKNVKNPPAVAPREEP